MQTITHLGKVISLILLFTVYAGRLHGMDEGVAEAAQASDANKELIEAAKTGDLGRAEAALANHAALDARNSSGMQALHHAARGGHLPIVHLLIERGAPLNFLDDSDFAPIHHAVTQNHVDIVRELLENGVPIATDTYLFGHGHLSNSPSPEITQLLANYGDIPRSHDDTRVEAAFNNDPLLVAIALHDENRALELLANYLIEKPAAEERPEIGESKEGEGKEEEEKEKETENVVQRFLSRRPTPREKKLVVALPGEAINSLSRALVLAAGQGETDIVKFILTYFNQALPETTLQEALTGAAFAGHIGNLSLILNYVSASSEWKQALDRSLFLAAVQQHEDIVNLILKRSFEHHINLDIHSVGRRITRILRNKFITDEQRKNYSNIRATLIDAAKIKTTETTLHQSQKSEEISAELRSLVALLPPELIWLMLSFLQPPEPSYK